MMTLQIAWFFLVGVLLTGYAILDGFDLGAGFWYLFAKGDKNRRMILNGVGPVWDGNEVWLLTGGGALFAAFPPVYATVFSGFYLALLVVLLGLIARAVSLEFRSKVENETWRKGWDWAFGLGSTVPALLFGVALGNVMRGIPMDAFGDFTGSFFTLLNPYSLVIGLTGLAMLLTHGGIFIQLKAYGKMEDEAKVWTHYAWIAYMVLFVLATILTFATQSHLTTNFWKVPPLGLIPIITGAAIVAAGIFNRRCEPVKAFIASAVSIAGMMGIVGASLFPNMVRALGNPDYSLTIFNSSSSQLTLTVMLIIALVGMPVVIGYTIWIYNKFKGKVEVEKGIY
jgi:cytochrome d ubiquinol oxidase subunit II